MALLLSIGFGAALHGAANPAPDPQALAQAALQVLDRRCFACHGEHQQLSSLALHDRESLLRGGKRGPAIAEGAGPADRSRLYRLAAHLETPHMPPTAPLPAGELETLRLWAEAGAPYPEGDGGWWAYQPVRRPPVPEVGMKWWVRNQVDAFILERLERAGLKPSPTAGRRELIRRLYYDLLGLPPTPEEVQAFVEDTSPAAYPALVERLLASPHYGERWGRHWLDVARYADSSGFEFDIDRPNAWRYRDYVIRSFNEDKPYDQFVREQLAADEIAPDNLETLPALGFIAAGPTVDNQQSERIRMDEIDDMIGATTSAFLAQTVACARCHDHKYDPISARDYYALAAVFNHFERRDLVVADEAERAEVARQNAEIDQQVAPLREKLALIEEPYRKKLAEENDGKVEDGPLNRAIRGDDKARRDELLKQLTDIDEKRPKASSTYAITDKGPDAPETFLLLGGEPERKAEPVEPGFLSVLTEGEAQVPPPPPGATTTHRRKALAEWIASPENPLTARVAVNRVWQGHFGRGIVGTPSNFGRTGDRPSHPELLDWLAAEFVEQGWSIKAMHRLIVNSNTYKQAARPSPEAAMKDPHNRLLSYLPLRRLEGEAVRDSLLAISGSLNRAMGGPGVYPPIDPEILHGGSTRKWPETEEGPDVWRRSVYVFVKRSVQLPVLEVFDCPDTTTPQPARSQTVIATQALALLNNPFTRLMAERFADRVVQEAGEGRDDRLGQAYHLALSRPPSPEETRMGRWFLAEQVRFHLLRGDGHQAKTDAEAERAALADFCHVLFNLNEFLYLE
jgi:hypothetical protein